MTIPGRNNANDATKMIRTLCVLFFVILLRDYYTGDLGWHWPMLMATVVIILLVVNGLLTPQQNARQRNPYR